MIVYHHNDLDGRCAGAIVAKAARQKRMSLDTKIEREIYREVNYKDTIDIGEIQKDETIVIVDFSFKPELMRTVKQKTDNIIWIDHHKTAIGYVSEYGFNPAGIRNYETPGKSGCQLAWQYFFPEETEPDVVRYIGDMDAWVWKYPETSHYVEGLRLHEHRPVEGFALWNDLLLYAADAYQRSVETRYTKSFISNGKIAIQYRRMICEDYCRSHGFEMIFDGKPCFATGLYMWGSLLFGEERMRKYDICFSFEFSGEKWTIGLYSKKPDIDVSLIAQSLGGGGHKGAAGFVCDELPSFLRKKNA